MNYSKNQPISKVNIGHIPFSIISFGQAINTLSKWGNQKEKCKQVVLAYVHSVVVAEKNPDFLKVCMNSDLVLADGVPIVWVSRMKESQIPVRIAGPDLMWLFLKRCAKRRFTIFLLGGENEQLLKLKSNLENANPGIQIVGTYSPPFGVWSQEENDRIIKMVNASKADILLLGVTSPKQDIWIARHRDRLTTHVAIGFGAAFDFHSGRKIRAPRWIQRMGMEWFFRFLQDPKRLWSRYLFSNLHFIFLMLSDSLLRKKRCPKFLR
jgi:N-acetylglucosaminyldiphosphoundecaprenol N-acetyl-beta-D-mannosaminyltransferase